MWAYINIIFDKCEKEQIVAKELDQLETSRQY